MQKKIDLLEEKLDKALETIRCLDKSDTLENMILKKDLEIENLEKKIEVIESKINMLLENKDGKPKKKSFKCKVCGFEANSHQGLKIHREDFTIPDILVLINTDMKYLSPLGALYLINVYQKNIPSSS